LGRRLHLKGKAAEDFLYELSKRSFLDDWCYRNPKLPNGKEICDLLVIYDDVAIIWQVKDLKLDALGKYKRSEVEKNLHQLSTAKNRLLGLKIPIKLENSRRGKEIFDPTTIKRVYLLSALLGTTEDYFSFAENIKGGIAHTFTRDFSEIVLTELDTIKDFIDYLDAKEDLLLVENRLTLLGGEEELLAYYIMGGRNFETLKKADFLVLEEGFWKRLQKKPKYIAKQRENSISYGWDSIINRAHTSGGSYEIIARELARSNRFERRVLARSFYDAHVLAHKEYKNNIFHRCMSFQGVTYCFLFSDESSEKRRSLLSAICFMARGSISNKQVIGIATEIKIRSTCSYDFCLLELPEWTEEHQKEMQLLQKQTGLFKNPKMKHSREEEYPK